MVYFDGQTYASDHMFTPGYGYYPNEGNGYFK